MAAWDCPRCGRRFARSGQGHECEPAMDLSGYLATGPAFEEPIFRAVMAGLTDVGPIVVEPLSVGIYLKRAQTFATLRPLTKWEAVSFMLDRTATHRCITRKVLREGDRHWHTANVATSDEVDQPLLDLLTEAYLLAPPA